MSDEQPIKRKRGRPRKVQLTPVHETPTIKEGASWHVGLPEEEQDELKKRHNEAMEKKANLDRAIELDDQIAKAMEQIITPNAVIQLRTESRMGQFALVGEVDGDTVYCYEFIEGGINKFTVKANEVFLVSGPKRGLRVATYERPEEAPDWKKEE